MYGELKIEKVDSYCNVCEDYAKMNIGCCESNEGSKSSCCK